ncbi:MAG: pyridoxamine 5'-phosphate oxidase [Planctomycetaceae bacterium]|nr:pyridoxamine 5'-phosphate oxidase [Planctomycetaceae bacterium]
MHDTRREYDATPIDENSMASDPYEEFEKWYQAAVAAELLEPNAMTLSTVDEQNRPTSRTVLLKFFDRKGFVFFTNLESRKARQIAANPRVAILFQWLPLQRQLAIEGTAERVSALESLKYFASRPRGSQLGAWVSQQSSVITSRSLLEAKLAELKQKFAGGEVPLPSFWGGFRVVPDRLEFWQGQPNRLHDRIEYLLQSDGTWIRQRLSP